MCAEKGHDLEEFVGISTVFPKIDGMDVETEKCLPVGKGKEIDEVGFVGGEIEFPSLAKPGGALDASGRGGGQHTVMGPLGTEIGTAVVVVSFQ